MVLKSTDGILKFRPPEPRPPFEQNLPIERIDIALT